MKKKGFTLVELLAVIAILAILVIIVLPNVMGMFKTAKKNSFTTEVKKIAQTAEQQWMYDSMITTSEKIYARCSEGCGPGLDLSGRTELDYYVKLNKSGKIVRLYATDGTYQYEYEYNDEELNIEDIGGTLEVQDLEQSNIITIDNNSVKKGGLPIVASSGDVGGTENNEDDFDDSQVDEQYVARIKQDYYTTIANALTAANENDEIFLIRDTTENVTNKKNVTINLHKHKLTGSINNNANYTLKLVNGSIDYAGYVITNAGTLIVGEKNKPNSGVTITDTRITTADSAGIKNTSIVEFNAGTINASGNGAYGISGGTVTMNGGTINATAVVKSYGISATTLTFNGGTINSTCPNRNAYGASGNIEMNGGIINATTTEYLSGTTNEAIAIQGSSFIMNGGEINSNAHQSAIGIKGGNITIKKGTVNAKGMGSRGIFISGDNGVVTIENGTINASTTDASTSTYYTARGVHAQSIDGVLNLNGGSIKAQSGKNPVYGISTTYTRFTINIKNGLVETTSSDADSRGISGGEITKIDNGTIKASSNLNTAHALYYGNADVNKNITINGGVIEATSSSNKAYSLNVDCPSCKKIILNMNDGKLKAKGNTSSNSIVKRINSYSTVPLNIPSNKQIYEGTENGYKVLYLIDK